ncbi:MAG: hypothetical protein GY723_07705 [bacterium]|nr:hypothetical protein [bacterium]MCP5067547.1 hypothetical protein [bacterium]
MRIFRNFGFKLMAVVTAFLLWGISHSTSSIERGFDLPVALVGVPDKLVVTQQSVDTVNVRVRGSRASLRRLSVGDLVYGVDLSGAQHGVTAHTVETQELELPRGLQVVSRSPAGIEFTLTQRGRKAVPLRPDVAGDPAPGFVIEGVEVEPARIWITGARSEVLRLAEVMTETIDVNGADEPVERKVKPALVGHHVWVESEQDVTVRIQVAPLEVEPEVDAEETG